MKKRAHILDGARVRACTMNNLRPFYELYKGRLEQYSYHPALTFNIDETSINFTQRFKSKVITSQQHQSSITTQPDRVSSTTLVLCIPALGQALDSTMLWSQKHIPEEFRLFPVHNIRVMTESAWQTKKTFQEMMLHYYLPNMIARRTVLSLTATPILVILDGHSSRLSLPVVDFCRKNNIHMLILPAHTSNITQPLDCAPNGVLKNIFCKECAIRVNFQNKQSQSDDTDTSSNEDTSQSITSSQIDDGWTSESITEDDTLPPLPDSLRSSTFDYRDSSSAHRRLLSESLPRALDAALSQKVIASGWRKSGLYPYNPDAILHSLPEGVQIPPHTRGPPSISARMITDDEMFYEICKWRLSLIEKDMSNKQISQSVSEKLLEESRWIQSVCPSHQITSIPIHSSPPNTTITVPHQDTTPKKALITHSTITSTEYPLHTKHNSSLAREMVRKLHVLERDPCMEKIDETKSSKRIDGHLRKRKREPIEVFSCENEQLSPISSRERRKCSVAEPGSFDLCFSSEEGDDEEDENDIYI